MNSSIENQKSRVEHLPTVIFQSIQDFLSHKDYRCLMYSNKATFRCIKYETIQYVLTNPQRLISIHEDNESFFRQLVNEKVKDKSKQIVIKIKEMPQWQFPHLAPKFQGIHYLFLSEFIDSTNSFDFNVFNNIYHVKVENVRRIETISSGFENVSILEIRNFNSLKSVIGINSTRTLQTFKIEECYSLETLNFPVETITSFTCWGSFLIDSIVLLRQMPKVSNLTIRVYKDESLQEFLSLPIRWSALHVLKLSCQFQHPSDMELFDCLTNIQQLTLISRNPNFPLSFKKCSGKYLELASFNLSSIEETLAHASPNLRSLRLDTCTGFIQFPMISSIIELKIRRCHMIQQIPTLTKLKTLKIEDCKSLVSIAADQPALRFCTLVLLPIADLSFAARPMDFLSLTFCDKVTDVSKLRQVKNLEIVD